MNYTNSEIDEILDNHPLLLEGFEALECPNCNTLCFPKTKFKNNTIRYTLHKCQNEYEFVHKMKSFSILENGDLKS